MKSSLLYALPVLSLVTLGLMPESSFSQDFQENVLNSKEIVVSGQFAKENDRSTLSYSDGEDAPPEVVTDAELDKLKSEFNDLKKQTKLSKEKAKVYTKVAGQVDKFSEAQDEMIEGAVERQKAINEFAERKKLNETKLKCIMENMNSEDCNKLLSSRGAPIQQNVNVALAQQPVVSEASVKSRPLEKIKLLPFAGATSFNGEIEQLETEISAGLRVESDLNSRFAMGLGFKYDNLRTNDFANNAIYMTSTYFNNFGNQGREIQYRSFGVDIYGKFFITNTDRFKPFVGAGLSYNRASLKYNNNNPFYDQINAFYYGSEEFNTSFIAGQILLGSEVKIVEYFGLVVEGAYSTGLGRNLTSRSSRNGGNSPDQTRLRDLGNEIINSNAFSMYLSGVFRF